MDESKVRSILAILVVGGFVLLTCTLAVYPLFQPDIRLERFVEYTNRVSSLYSGIVGVILGWFFARKPA